MWTAIVAVLGMSIALLIVSAAASVVVLTATRGRRGKVSIEIRLIGLWFTLVLDFSSSTDLRRPEANEPAEKKEVEQQQPKLAPKRRWRFWREVT